MKNNKILQGVNFIEELTWILSKYNKESVKSVIDYINQGKEESKNNSNVEILTGYLPKLFLEKDLFATNYDLAIFAESVLGIEIPRYDKKSRFEIIGSIICEIPNLKNEQLKELSDALETINNNPSQLHIIKTRKKTEVDNFSWNETIQLINRCHEK